MSAGPTEGGVLDLEKSRISQISRRSRYSGPPYWILRYRGRGLFGNAGEQTELGTEVRELLPDTDTQATGRDITQREYTEQEEKRVEGETNERHKENYKPNSGREFQRGQSGQWKSSL